MTAKNTKESNDSPQETGLTLIEICAIVVVFVGVLKLSQSNQEQFTDRQLLPNQLDSTSVSTDSDYTDTESELLGNM
jgi:hypothetical protein